MLKEIIKVSELSNQLKEIIEGDFSLKNIIVEGELSNCRMYKNICLYFCLKDEYSLVNGIFFDLKNYDSLQIKDGAKVHVYCSVNFYEKNGNIQIKANKIVNIGQGLVFERRRKIYEELDKMNIFDQSHKKKIPLFPLNIAIICGKDAAAETDIKRCFERRWPIAKTTYFYSIVQGENAPKDIIKNIKLIDEMNFDAIVLARGGGSVEDLQCFDDKNLALTIFELKTFIVTGIGHERDKPIACFVSDLNASTPTAAIEQITPNLEDVIIDIGNYSFKLNKLFNNILNSNIIRINLLQKRINKFTDSFNYKYQYVKEKNKVLHISFLKKINEKLNFVSNKSNYLSIKYESILLKESERIKNYRLKNYNNFKKILCNKENSLLENKRRMNLSFKNKTNKINNLVKSYNKLLMAYNPDVILNKGYSLIYSDDVLIKNVKQVSINEKLMIKMKNGKIIVKTEEILDE